MKDVLRVIPRQPMTRRPHTDPLPGHVAAVLSHEIQPRLAKLARELKHSLELSVVLVKDDHIVGTAPGLTARGRDTTAQRGKLRLTFLQVFNPASRLFTAEAKFEADDRTPAFTGFSVTGPVSSAEDGAVTSRAPTWVVHWGG